MTKPTRPEQGKLFHESQEDSQHFKFRSQSESEQVDALTKKIDDFLGAQHATPEQVKEVAQECLDSKMLMDADQIKDLAEQINSATGKFTPPLHPTYIPTRFCEECGQDQPGDGTASGRGGIPEDEG